MEVFGSIVHIHHTQPIDIFTMEAKDFHSKRQKEQVKAWSRRNLVWQRART